MTPGQRHRRVATVSLLAAASILTLKVAAWLLTGSVALASDAAESIANVVAGATLLAAVRLSRSPPDFEHPYGHEKVEDLSGAFEALLILAAAVWIAVASVPRLIDPPPLARIGFGMGLAALSMVANGALAAWLFRQAAALRSAALRANALHLRTDVVTSAGVLTGVALVALTGYARLDAIVALGVAAHIAYEGVSMLRGSISRLLDERLPPDEEAVVLAALRATPEVVGWHRLRSRRSGRARFVEVDVFVSGAMRVDEAHRVVGRIEDAVHARLPDLTTTIHVEPHVPGEREGATHPREEFAEGE